MAHTTPTPPGAFVAVGATPVALAAWYRDHLEHHVRPRRRRTLVFLVVCTLLACAAARAPLPSVMPELPAHYLEGRLLELTNLERVAAGLAPVRPSDVLTQAARHHAEEMVRLAYLSHVSPTEGRRTLGDRVGIVGGTFVAVGENLAAVGLGGVDLPDRVIAGWMASPGHRENLLGAQWTHAGLGAGEGRDGRLYVVQLFAIDPNPLTFVHATPGVGDSVAVRFEIVSEADGWVQVALTDVGAEPVPVAVGEVADVIVDGLPTTAPTHVLVGWAPAPGGALVGQESGWFDPTDAYWTRDWRSDRAVAHVLRYGVTAPARDVALQLAFERPVTDLVVFVDRRQAILEVTTTNVRFAVAGRDGVRHVEVGVPLPDGRVQSVHAFDVLVRAGRTELRAVASSPPVP